MIFSAASCAESPFSITGSVHIFTNEIDDATGYSLLFTEGINSEFDAAIELTRICDDHCHVTLAEARVSRIMIQQEKTQVRVFGGASYVRGEHDFRRNYDAVAPLAGISGTLALAPRLKLDASAGLSFFHNNLAELQAAVSRDIAPDFLISAGYKAYRSGGSYVGGPTISVTWCR